MDEHFQELVDQIQARRRFGRITCSALRRREPGNANDQADAITRMHGFRGLAEGWIAIPEEAARELVTHILHKDLAYMLEVMPRAEATTLADAFIAAVPEPCTYLTNATWDVAPEVKLTSWDPVSESTFDAGVICVGAEAIVLIWVEDED
jgi:hypothetical protein